MLSEVMENTHLYLSKSCPPKHFPHLQITWNQFQVHKRSSKQPALEVMLMAFQILRQLLLSISRLQADLKFYFQRERILLTFAHTSSLWFDEQIVIGNELTYGNERMVCDQVAQSLNNEYIWFWGILSCKCLGTSCFSSFLFLHCWPIVGM